MTFPQYLIEELKKPKDKTMRQLIDEAKAKWRKENKDPK